MAEKITGIVLNVRKYNDSNLILTLYTRERGRISFISPIGSGKSSNARRARLQPMSVINTELKYKPSAELQRLGSISASEVWNDIYFNPTKRAIIIFLSEFLYRLLNATMPDPLLFDFILDSLRFLDAQKEKVEDFHIPFLVSLLSFSGIQPDISTWGEGKVFEFSSGSFTSEYEASSPYLKGDEAKAVKFISRINFSNMKSLRLTSVNRRQIVFGLLNYYSYHFPGMSTLKSPEILREIFE